MTDGQLDIDSEAGEPPWDEIARQRAQRAWPPPQRPWLVSQTWEHVLFAHWPVNPALLRPLLPAQLALETFGGDAWLGIVPFHLRRIAPRGAPAPVGLGFPEINLRTYVTLGDKPGVWFFSLDAASLLAVVAARASFHLPYIWAEMQMREEGGQIHFRSRRRRRGVSGAEFAGSYQAAGPVRESSPDSLERWLADRYCFYAADQAGSIYRAEINHFPWSLQPARAEIAANTITKPLGIELVGSPLLHLARRMDIVAWWRERVA